MGSFVKALGTLGNVAAARLAAPAAADTSRGILKYSAANKTGLSLLLDGTLKQGHDMKTFGLGTAASLANISRYARFTAAMRHVYGAMEESLDQCTSPAVAPLWSTYGTALRRAPALSLDLADVALPLAGQELDDLYPPTAATRRYVDAIATAGAKDNADGGGRLIGHLYCRYFADLFGGQMLAAPTRYALGPAVLDGTPRHYDFGEFGANRKRSVEELYVAFNAAGDTLGTEEAQQEVVDEARGAFALNVEVYSEDGGLLSGALVGVANMTVGFARAKVGMPRGNGGEPTPLQ